VKAHRQWLGCLQPVGLVVAPAAIQEAGWVVTRSGSELVQRQEGFRGALADLMLLQPPQPLQSHHHTAGSGCGESTLNLTARSARPSRLETQHRQSRCPDHSV
jgi:hypothetical protein